MARIRGVVFACAILIFPPLGRVEIIFERQRKENSRRGNVDTAPRLEKFFATLRIFRPALRAAGNHFMQRDAIA